MRIEPFVDFCVARHQVYVLRHAGSPKPWTDDPILQRYRFCNVYRELDAVTVWIRNNWSTQYAGHEHLWFAMCIARLLNNPHSLAEVRPLPWQAKKFRDVLEARAAAGDKVFSPAYIVSTNGHSMPKVQYLAELVLDPMWARRDLFAPKTGDTLESYHTRLMQAQGMGSFMAAQVVADLKNSPFDKLTKANDWWSWAAPGPGSVRGLNRIIGNGAVSKAHRDFLGSLGVLRTAVNKRFRNMGWKELCAQDIQNCLCEYDKYERVRLGEGTPKQLYPGAS